jgi:hypothetical protein
VDQVVNAAPRQFVAQATAEPTSVDVNQAEFRGETPDASKTATTGAVNRPPSFAAKLASGTSEAETNPEQVQQRIVSPETTPSEPLPTAPAKKPGKPRTGTKERAFRVEGAKVVVTFLKKVPTTEEIIAALEQAIEKLRADTAARTAA